MNPDPNSIVPALTKEASLSAVANGPAGPQEGLLVLQGVTYRLIPASPAGDPSGLRSALFQATRKGWVLGLDGRQHSFEPLVGLRYIYELFSHPHRHVHVTELVRRQRGEAVDCLKEEELRDGGECAGLVVQEDTPQRVLDDVARRKLRMALVEAQKDLVELRKHGTPDNVEDQERAISRIKKCLARSKFRSHDAIFPSRAKQDRDSVRKAIDDLNST
jgi:hypothetical protein